MRGQDKQGAADGGSSNVRNITQTSFTMGFVLRVCVTIREGLNFGLGGDGQGPKMECKQSALKKLGVSVLNISIILRGRNLEIKVFFSRAFECNLGAFLDCKPIRPSSQVHRGRVLPSREVFSRPSNARVNKLEAIRHVDERGFVEVDEVDEANSREVGCTIP